MLHASTKSSMKRSGIAQDSIQSQLNIQLPIYQIFFRVLPLCCIDSLLHIVWFFHLFSSSVYGFLWISSSLLCVNVSVLQSFENQVQWNVSFRTVLKHSRQSKRSLLKLQAIMFHKLVTEGNLFGRVIGRKTDFSSMDVFQLYFSTTHQQIYCSSTHGNSVVAA